MSIEIDVRIDIKKESDYISAKSEVMMEHGTQKIVWVMTKPKKVMVIEKGLEPVIYDWDQDIELMENVSESAIALNLEQLMVEEDLQF